LQVYSNPIPSSPLISGHPPDSLFLAHLKKGHMERSGVRLHKFTKCKIKIEEENVKL